MRKRSVITLSVFLLVVLAAVIQVLRPVPNLQVHSTRTAAYHVPGTLKMKWPSQGSAAVEVSGVGLMGELNEGKVVPLASVAKLMTAYLTLKKHPLSAGANGPVITITAADAATYQADAAQNDSVAQVATGEKLTERQLLEALLLPSGDNIATLLAQWDAGHVAQFVQQMNQTAQQLGMTKTHYADPAGVNLATVGTAQDQLKIAQAAMSIPTLQAIVAMPQATLPVAGTVYNTDYVLGQDGIVGVKTGSMPQAGGNFVFATHPKVNGKSVWVLGCVLAQQGQKPLMTALHEGASLAKQATMNLKQVTLIHQGTQVADVSSVWANSAPVDATKTVSLIAWPGFTVKSTVTTQPLSHTVGAQTVVGELTLDTGSQTFQVPLQTTQAIAAPTLKWKLKR